MFSAKVVEESHVQGKVINPRPLFHKVESRRPAAVDRLEDDRIDDLSD
jgi:hypothetical protein